MKRYKVPSETAMHQSSSKSLVHPEKQIYDTSEEKILGNIYADDVANPLDLDERLEHNKLYYMEF